MDTTLAAWLIGAAIAILLAMLVIVRIARRLERSGAAQPRPSLDDRVRHMLGGKAAPATAQLHALAAASPAFRMLAGASRATGTAQATRAGKRIGIAVAGASAAVAIGAAVSTLKEDRNYVPPTPVEISAGALHGTLLSPKAKAPVVLIVPGSGPTDRDGNSPLGVKAGMYKLLAEELAEEGIATVRVDKRGMFGSMGAGNPNDVTVEKYAEDYRAWIDAIRAETGRKCVWLLGHSEGALMVSAAAEGRKDVCGLILVSGMGRRMGDVLRQQLKDNPANAPLLDQAFSAIGQIEAGQHVDTSTMHPALMPLFAPPVQDFLISVFAIDPVEAVRRADVKTLVVQGTTDLQVTVEDARLLNKAPHTKLELIKGMNHVLKKAPADRAANIATYADPDLPLHPRLVDKIEDFIEGE